MLSAFANDAEAGALERADRPAMIDAGAARRG
jgi:hypothetical protein